MTYHDLLITRRDEILHIAARHGADNVRVFGSVVRGQDDAESDIDLVVDLQPGRSLLDLGGLWWDLNEALQVRVDVITENGLRESIRQRVLSEAVPL